MKVIDLLNKIANGEDVPKKVKYYDVTYEYVDYNNDFNKYRGIEHITIFLFDITDNLNDEVKVVEDKKIEKLDQTLNRLDIGDDYYRYIMENRFKINEIIDYLEEK